MARSHHQAASKCQELLMKYQKPLSWLIPLIGILSLFAAASGLFWPGDGAPYAYTTLRGEQVMINAQGLYYYDTVSSTAQMQANDLITLVLVLPLLAVSSWLAWRGSLRGRLLLTGTLGFFLYTYMSMCFATHFNALFLVYVALFTLSLFAFILAMMSFDLETLPAHFSERLPRRAIAGLLFAAGLFLLLAWVGGRVLPAMAPGAVPALENVTSMVIQVLDLGLILPACFLAAILLLRRQAWGYLLSSVAVMKMLTMGVAVSTMGINMALQGVPDSVVIVGIFITLTLTNMVLAVLLLKNVRSPQVAYK
jgi:hypothetical protein